MSVKNRFFEWLKGPDFRTFLVFVGIAILILFIEKLHLEYNATLDYKITCKNIPAGYVIDESTISSAQVIVHGEGSKLLMLMHANNNREIEIDLSETRPQIRYNDKPRAVVLPRIYRKKIIESLPDGVKLEEVVSDTIYIPMLKQHKKYLPVRISTQATLQPQHIYSRPTVLTPDSVWVSGTNNYLDTMTAVYTEKLPPIQLNDTYTTRFNFVLPQGVSCDYSDVEVKYFVEMLTQKDLQVPVTAIGVPNGYRMMTFPQSITVTFSVGLSNYEKIEANSFDIVADMSNITPGSSQRRIKLKIAHIPDNIYNINYSPISVEYLLERIGSTVITNDNNNRLQQ